MVAKTNLQLLHVPENVTFLLSAVKILAKYNVNPEKLGLLYAELGRICTEIEASVALDQTNEKVKAKNAADRLRERRHSRFYSYLQSILFDDTDPRFANAQHVMAVVKALGSPRDLSESRENVLFISLEKSLEPLASEIESIGATTLVNEMLAANREFVALEIECRAFSAQQSQRPSTGALCKQANAVLKTIIGAINTFIALNGDETYRAVEADMNELVDKFDQIVATRRTSIAKKGEAADAAEAAQ